jgi:hypothetical protein
MPPAPSAAGSSNSITGKLARHARIAIFSDGLMNMVNATPGPASIAYHAMEYINGALRPAVGFDQTSSGETLASMLARVDKVIGMKPDVVVWHGSHNDFNGSYTNATNPAWIPAWDSTWTNVAGYITKWDAIQSALEAGLPDAIILPLLTINSSTGTNDTAANLDTIWGHQRAAGSGPGGGNRGSSGKGRTLPIDFGGTGASPTINPATMTYDGTHLNYLGGKTIGRGYVGPKLATIVTATTQADIVNQRSAFTGFGADVYADTEYRMEGTTGQVAGTPLPTGSFAAGKRVTSNLTNGASVAVVGSKDTSHTGDPWPYEIQDVAVSGTPASANTIVQDEATSPSSTVTLGVSSAVIGRYYEMVLHKVVDNGAGAAPVGFRSYQVALGSFGQHGVASSTSAASQDYDFALDAVIRTPPKTVYQTNPALISGNLSVNPAITSRHSAVAQTTRHRRDRQMLRQVELVAYAAPFLTDSYITGPNDKLRIIGTATGTTTLIAHPGQWSGGGITYDPKWYLDGVLVASAWVYTLATPGAGHTVMFKPNPTNSIGSDTTTSVSVATS